MAKVQIKAFERHTKSGKVVTIRAHDQNRDTVGDQLKTEGRAPVAAQPGNFPNGRSTPTTPGVARYEEERQEAEVRAAQIRARMAQAQLEQAQKPQEEEKVQTPQQVVASYSIADQFDALMAAEQAGIDLPADDDAFAKMAPTLLKYINPNTGEGVHKLDEDKKDKSNDKGE